MAEITEATSIEELAVIISEALEISLLHPRSIECLQTVHGPLRVITPTLCVIDRLAASLYGFDRQCWDQAGMVCRSHSIDWDAITSWARNERLGLKEVERLRAEADSQA